MVLSKLAEFHDPLGFWEPYKLQLKLDNSLLNGHDWDTPLGPELEELWKARFHEFLSIPDLRAPRCLMPSDAINPSKMRLICIADAAEKAGGAAIYGGWELPDGMYSCQLLTARSKIMNQTVPRNELEAVKVMTELAEDVIRSLGDKVSEVFYFTDSTVAMCWSHSLKQRLRLFTLHRVTEIRVNILGRENMLSEELPLYHIDGKLNPADLLTKRHDLKPLDISSGSVWQTGFDWMKLPLDKMPITRYSDLTVKKSDQEDVDQECFPDPYLTGHCIQNTSEESADIDDVSELQVSDLIDDCDCPVSRPLLMTYVAASKGQMPDFANIDLRYYGYKKSLRMISYLVKVASVKTHSYHVKKGVKTKADCLRCKAYEECGDSHFQTSQLYCKYAFECLLRIESEHLRATLPSAKLKQFTDINGILYYQSRLSEENPVTTCDLGFEVFFDHTSIKSLLPVVSANRDLFLVYALHIHETLKLHTGVEALLRECLQSMYVIHNPRRVLKKIRSKCTRCRLIAKKTLELRIMNHPDVRTIISPPFYNAMIDTVYGFRGQSFKGARGKTFKMYALIIVCLLTGAVNILAMEGLETQDVIQALERHSGRHGIPKRLFVDNGTQLVSLDRVEFDTRDLQLTVEEDLGVEVIVSTPKSHEERGRVEIKVKTLRDMMKKLAVDKESVAMTALQWETLFAKISSMINDLPLAKGSTSTVSDLGWDVITPNRLMLGRNNCRSLEGSMRVDHSESFDRLLQRNNAILKVWYQMFISRLHHLIPRPNKWVKDDTVKEGDIVTFVYNDNPAMDCDVWKLGRVESVLKPTKVQIKFVGGYKNDKPKFKTLTRSPRDICIVQAADELSVYARDQDDVDVKQSDTAND